MATNITKSIILITIILYIISKPQILSTQSQQQVPCLFIMGDSQFDSGNNNFLLTLAKANYLPYGIDYTNGPTGRFASGKLISDFLAEFLGFDSPIPPFTNSKCPQILKGVNYASGGAGLLDETGKLGGDRISMNKQLLNHEFTVFEINILLGNLTRAQEYLNKCLYISNMGSNDFLNNYFLPQLYQTSTIYTPHKFADLLIEQYCQQLRALHSHGARKIVVFGLGLLGCVPQMSSMYPTNGSTCVDSINHAAHLFNTRLKKLIHKLNYDLPNAQFTLINTFNIVQQDPAALGIKVRYAPCCIVSPLTGLCVLGTVPCSNRNEYSFWDNFHPSEVWNRVIATRAYNATLASDVYPIDISRLVQQ